MAFICDHCFKGKENANALQIGLPNFLGIKTAVHKMILPKIFDWYFHQTIASQRGEEQNRKTLNLPISKCRSAKSQ